VTRHSVADEQLIEGFRTGCGPASERELFDEIFQRYHSRVAAWCYRFTRDHELALDLTQEIFLKAFRRFHTFRSDSKISTWLYSITRNHCIDAVNKRAGEPVDASDIATLRIAHPAAIDVTEVVQRRQEQGFLLRVVAGSLSKTEATVMALHYGHDVPIQTVTKILDLKNASGAKAYIVSARRKLSSAVREWKDGRLPQVAPQAV